MHCEGANMGLMHFTYGKHDTPFEMLRISWQDCALPEVPLRITRTSAKENLFCCFRISK
jgi:hypothetical protein